MKIRQDDTHDTVYFSDMMWYVLSKWRSVIVTAIIMALVFGGFSYAKSLKDVKYAERIAGINVEAEIENGSNELKDAVKRQEQTDYLKNYISNGLLMSMSPSSVNRVTLKYYVDGSIDESLSDDARSMRTSALAQAYVGKATGERARNKVIDGFEGDIVANDLDYLLIGSATDNTFSVVIKGPDDETCSKIAEYVKSIVSDSTDELKKSIGNHMVELVDESHTFGNDSAINDAQTSVNKSYTTLKDKLKTATNALDAGEKEILDAMVFQNEGKIPQTASVSKKYIVIGFLLGIIVVAVVHMIRYAYTGKVITTDQVYHTCKAPVVGEITVGYDRHRTALDRKIYRKLFGIRKASGPEKEIDYISLKLANICKAQNVKSLYVINGVSAEGKSHEHVEQILKKIGENGIETASGHDDGCNADVVKGVTDADAVVVFAGLFVTDFTLLGNQVAVCRQQNKEIIGSVVEV